MNSATPVLECQNLSKRYGSTLALDSISLSLSAGEPIALIGPNGAGKTTLISVLCGFVAGSAGHVSVLGHAPGSRALNGLLAALPQDALLDPRLGIGRQLRLLARLQGMSATQARKAVDRVLQAVDMRDSIESKPTDLSHGMRKRIDIAQTLLGSPRLVLLDEPTAGIDPPNARIIRELIREQSPSMTFIISSHNLDELERLCSTVIYLEKGRLVSVGPVDDEREEGLITVRLIDVPEEAFLAAAVALPGVRQVTRRIKGEYLITTIDDMQTSGDLIELLLQQGWRYRQLARGRSLEERLYGSDEASGNKVSGSPNSF